MTDTADPLLSFALHPLLTASNCLLMALDRLLNGWKQLKEAAMEIRRHLHNETSRAIGGFLGFAQCLLRPNVVTAVGNVLLIRLASLVLVDVSAATCLRTLSRRMLEHYSHIRIDAKRQALDALDESRRDAHNSDRTSGDADADGDRNGDSPEPPKNGAEIPLFVALSESHTSQFAFGGIAALR